MRFFPQTSNQQVKVAIKIISIAACFSALPVFAVPQTAVRYVGIDHQSHSAYIYDENFNRLLDSPYIEGGSIDPLPEGQPIWFLGTSVDIVKRNPDGSVDVVSDDPDYYEMNHHFTWVYVSESRGMTSDCGFPQPVAAGSELTDFLLPSGYGYKMDGGFLHTGDWHWENPANKPHDEQVFLRFVFVFDDSAGGYRDTDVAWIDAVNCDSSFAVPSGKSTHRGDSYPVDNDRRIVAVIPHVHDHAKSIALTNNGERLRRFKPANASISVAHDDVGEGPTPYHDHKNHLPTDGLSAWTPGAYGPIVRAGDSLSTFAKFKNPHPRAIDNMVIFVTYSEKVPAGETSPEAKQLDGD